MRGTFSDREDRRDRMVIRRGAAVPSRADDGGPPNLPIRRPADPVDPPPRGDPRLEARGRALAAGLLRVGDAVGIQEDAGLRIAGPEQGPVRLAPLAAVEVAREYDAATLAQLPELPVEEPGRFDPGLRPTVVEMG